MGGVSSYLNKYKSNDELVNIEDVVPNQISNLDIIIVIDFTGNKNGLQYANCTGNIIFDLLISGILNSGGSTVETVGNSLQWSWTKPSSASLITKTFPVQSNIIKNGYAYGINMQIKEFKLLRPYMISSVNANINIYYDGVLETSLTNKIVTTDTSITNSSQVPFRNAIKIEFIATSFN